MDSAVTVVVIDSVEGEVEVEVENTGVNIPIPPMGGRNVNYIAGLTPTTKLIDLADNQYGQLLGIIPSFQKVRKGFQDRIRLICLLWRTF